MELTEQMFKSTENGIKQAMRPFTTDGTLPEVWIEVEILLISGVVVRGYVGCGDGWMIEVDELSELPSNHQGIDKDQVVGWRKVQYVDVVGGKVAW